MALYNAFKKRQLGGTTPMNPTTATLKVALVTASYTPDIDSHAFFSDITNEVSGAGYVAGGAALANKAVTQDNTNDRAYLDADDTSWVSSTITNARYGIVYDASTGVASTSPLVGYIDFGANKSTTGDTFTIQWATPSNGAILYLA